MWYGVIVVTVILIVYFVWANRESKRSIEKQQKKNKEKPLVRTEEDLEEYGKPLDSHPVDFNDEE